jgi:hypothetical protein
VNYPGDFPSSPEERAALSLAVNAAWLARAKAGGHTQSEAAAPGVWEAAAEKMMERDNATALAAARRDIAIERKAQKCYICGRRDLPRWARRYGLAAAGLFALPSFAPTAHAMLAREFVFFDYLGAVALGAALAAWMYEAIKPDDEEKLRKRFNEQSHS